MDNLNPDPTTDAEVFRFEQLHIDIARNATDDFNPFHDPQRWNRINGNTFKAPVALGFQIECLLDYLLDRYRQREGKGALPDKKGLHFRNYELKFAGALLCGENFQVVIKKTLDRTSKGGGLSNRLVVRKVDGSPVLVGSRSDTPAPRFLADDQVPGFPDVFAMEDRSNVAGTPFFLKRKFLTTSNGKNFLLGSLVDQYYYFDELEERVLFPAVYPVALSSCALLEKVRQENYEFEKDPVVYTSHKISVDRRLQRELRSNDRLDILVAGPYPAEEGGGLGRSAVQQSCYHCFGLIDGNRLLFRALVHIATLEAMMKQINNLQKR
jgi:hypothetical protein